MALGSEAELKTQLKLVVRMKYLTEAEIAPMLSLASEVGRMLRGLIKSLKQHLELRRRP
jgi:four helix bundle protein